MRDHTIATSYSLRRTMATASQDPQQQLQWEARQRPRAGVAAVIAVIGLLGSLFGQLTLGKDIPSPSGLQALQRGVQPGPVDQLKSLQVPRFEYLTQHKPALILVGVAGLIGAVATAWAIGFLAVAVRSRLPEVKRFIIYLPIVGGVLSGISTFIGVFVEIAHDNSFLDGSRTVAAAADSSGLAIFIQYIGFFGALALAIGYVLVSLSGMRSGLLTRPLGVIGIIAGALLILPIVPLLSPLFEILYLAAAALLFFNFWLGEMPPAWSTGTAVPWPTREPAPKRGGGPRGGGGMRARAAAAPAPAPEPAAPSAGGDAPRRRRKKRR
jgi:hypothetical protein